MEAPILLGPNMGPTAVMDKVYAELCKRCRGTGLVDIPGLQNLSMNQIAALTKGRTYSDLMILLKGRTPVELDSILKNLGQT